MDRVKPIIIKDIEKGVDYTLEFNREAIKFAEMRGFNIEDIEKYAMTKIPELWYYAFRMHHRNVPREKTDKLLEAIGGATPEMLERLGQLYTIPFETVVNMSGEEVNPNFKVEL